MSSITSDANFSDLVPEYYDREMGPVFFESHAVAMADRLPVSPGMQVLEIAAGTGWVTRHLLERLPADGKLTVSDLHPDMLAIAQQTIDDPRIEWEQADALALPFADNRFDVVVCQFGSMFYPDKVEGHREAFRVLKPGGIYLVTTWCSHQENLWAKTIHAKMADVFPDDPPLFMRKPFSYCDQEALGADLVEAGFEETAMETVPHELVIEDLPKTLRGMLLGSPLGAAIAERNGDVTEIGKLIAQDFKEFGGESPHRSIKTALFVSARKPKHHA
jgi:ubiquinone/menaquinone biosynthesis C-methylase UbiE